MFFHGMLATGASPSTARLTAVQGAVEPSTYSTTISPKPSYDPNTKKCTVKEDETFIRGLQVEIGYTWDAQTGVPKQIFKVDGKDLHDNLRMDSTTHFIVDKDMATSMYAKENNCFPVAAQFTMAADSHSFTGSITLIRDGKETENFCWNGSSTSKKQSVEDTDAAMAFDDEPRSLPEPAAFVSVPSTGDEPLSTLDLFTLCHAPTDIQKDAQDMLMEVMKYVIADKHSDWLTNFLASQKPVISPELQKIAAYPESEDFYTNFAIPYIGLGIYQQKGEGIPEIPLLEARTMLYYFQNGLAKQKGYTTQTNALYLQSFVADKPRLQAYIDDQEKRKSSGDGEYYWAEKLHEAVLSHDNIDTMVSSVIHNQGDIHQQLRDYGSVLNLLQPSGKLAQDAYTKLLTAVFHSVTEEMNPKTVEDKMRPWVKDFIQEWVNKFDKGEPPQTDTKAHQAWEAGEALKEAAHLLGGLADLADQVTSLIASEQVSNIYERAFGVSNKIVEKLQSKMSPQKLRILKRSVVTSVHVTALITTVQAFMKWKEVPDQQKVALVAQTVELGIEIFIDLPMIMQDAVDIFKVVRKFMYKSETLEKVGGLFGRMATKVGEWVEDIARVIREFLPEGAERFVIASTTFFKGMFESLPRVLGYIAPIVSLIVLIANIITLVEEPSAPIQDKILLIVQIVAGFFETAFLAAGLIAEELLSFAGPFAILAVVAAFVQFFVDMFDKPDPPPSPAQTFYTDTLKPKIDTYTKPPQDFDPDGKVPPPKKKPSK